LRVSLVIAGDEHNLPAKDPTLGINLINRKLSSF
jgi:hypothetical protein